MPREEKGSFMKKEKLRLGIAQINCTVGDISGNAGKILQYIQKAQAQGVELLSFPELALTGYPPEDLLLKAKFVSDNQNALKDIAGGVGEICVILGFVDRHADKIYNAAAVLYKGKVRGVYRKMLLPNYGVFDEQRYFSAGEDIPLFRLGKIAFSVNICEDIWHTAGPLERQAKKGSSLIININASPYYAGKMKEREKVIREQARKHKAVISYANLIGGQDELVFDGQSLVVDSSGRIISCAEAFKEELLVTDLEITPKKSVSSKSIITLKDKLPVSVKKAVSSRQRPKPLDPVAEVYEALLLGLRDYVSKNGFRQAVIGLSGGVDSALVASLAVDALGKENVTGVFMPTRYSSQESLEDAQQLAQKLGVRFINISIEQTYAMYLLVLEPHFSGRERDITEENLQARIRGNILMALSNKFGWLVLTTGNKSEMSTGYATLYGDMAGGLAVIKDVPKTLVYKLSRYRNSLGNVIPERILTKEPTAELRPNQKDRDTLPAYEELDPILKSYVEEDKDLKVILASGVRQDIAEKVLRMVDRSEYKRRQSPPGIKITPKAFGRDRRMPITNKYKG